MPVVLTTVLSTAKLTEPLEPPPDKPSPALTLVISPCGARARIVAIVAFLVPILLSNAKKSEVCTPVSTAKLPISKLKLIVPPDPELLAKVVIPC